MAEIGTTVRELLKKKRVSENLPVYTDSLMAMYEQVAYLRLAFNYYIFSEMYFELPKDRKNACKNEVEALLELVSRVILGKDNTEDNAEEKITALRNEIIGKMDTVTAFSDKLCLYEYILNRIEFKFNECDYNIEYYKNGFETDIYNYVTSDKDNSVINMRLQMVMGELPMRLSKNKFYDILRESFSIYIGSDKLSVRDFEYRIRTAGGIYSTTKSDKTFNKLLKVLDEFKEIDFTKASEKEYELYRSKLDKAAELTIDFSDSYMTLTEIVNDIYSIELCKSVDVDFPKKQALIDIIEYCSEVIKGEKDADVAMAEAFVEFEGLQEELRYKIDAPENSLTEIYKINRKEIVSSGLENSFLALEKLSKLQSSSTFVTFEEDEELYDLADESYISSVVDALVEDFAGLFKDTDRTYTRAVMAAVISNLPAYFNNLSEFEEYVHVSLSQCNDIGEQKACMTLINMLMANE